MRTIRQRANGRICRSILALSLSIGVSHDISWAQMLTRGPYLQSGSHSSIVVRWRTDVVTDSRVRFGTNAANLNFVVDYPTDTTEHELVLRGLWPDTKFYYSIGSTTSTLAGGDTNHFFVTAPPPGASKNTRVWVIGDAGTRTAGQLEVRDAYEAFTRERGTDLWLMLGDNAYYVGTDLEYQSQVFDVYTNLLRNSVVWPTLGNHDTYSVEASGHHAYFDIFTLPTDGIAGGSASGTEHYYSFDYGRIHFVCLDSMESSRSPHGAMATWLRDDLTNTRADWVIAFWHQPPYSRGSHDSDVELQMIEMRQNIVPLLDQGGVDLVLSGHSHSYERSYLLDGHYGASATFRTAHKLNDGDGREAGGGAYHKPRGGSAPHQGVVYAVMGSSGRANGGTLDHPAMEISLNQLGSMVLDITSNRLDATLLSTTGTTNDWFTLLKVHDAPTASNLTATISGDFTSGLSLSGSDPELGKITFAIAMPPVQGLIASLDPLTGALTYLPAHGRAGPDEFTFRTHNGYMFSPPATVTLDVVAPLDTNANSLPDYWESAYGVTNAVDDEDGDGASNWQEYVANSNPTNAASVLRVTEVVVNASGHCRLTWSAIGGTRYRVSYRDGSPLGDYEDIERPADAEIDPSPAGVASSQGFDDDYQLTLGPPYGRARYYRVQVVRQ